VQVRAVLEVATKHNYLEAVQRVKIAQVLEVAVLHPEAVVVQIAAQQMAVVQVEAVQVLLAVMAVHIWVPTTVMDIQAKQELATITVI
jgi:hypothetical protein